MDFICSPEGLGALPSAVAGVRSGLAHFRFARDVRIGLREIEGF